MGTSPGDQSIPDRPGVSPRSPPGEPGRAAECGGHPPTGRTDTFNDLAYPQTVGDGQLAQVRSGLGNHLFTPVSRTFTVDDTRTMWLSPDVNRPLVIRVEQYGAAYDFEADWVCA